MNSIVIRKRTDGLGPIDVLSAGRNLFAALLLAVVWITFTPFSGASIGQGASGGNLVNQLGYTSFFLAASFITLTALDRRVITALFSLPWLLLFVLVLASTTIAPVPGDALRGAAFSLIAIMLAAQLMALPRSADAFSSMLIAVSLLVLGLSYAGVILDPYVATHQASEVEAQHAGLWRGLFIHKNIAGPVMAAITFGGIYLMRRGHWIPGVVIALAGFIFVWKTGSKTSLALTPVIAFIVLVPGIMGLRWLTVILALAAMVGIHAFTIGTIFVPAFDDILRAFDPETTFTGRIEIWQFARDYLAERPWFGFGFDGFWKTAVVAGAEQPFDRAWDPRGIIHGHNGYLDVALRLGFPALAVMIWVTVLAPAWSYLQTPLKRENVLLSDLLFMIVIFGVTNAALESFFFNRADPVWLTLVIALFGLRLLARFPVSKS